jgi:very-short-patch-repair endonuclease
VWTGTSEAERMEPRPLPAEIAERPFSIAEARGLGVPRQRVRRRDLIIPTRGIRRHRDADADDLAVVRSVAALLRPGQHVSHTSAALLWGLPVPLRCRRSVHITTISPGNAMERPGVIGHTADPTRASMTASAGIALSTPAAAWAECATLLSVDELVALGDAIVTEERCLTTVDDLRAEILRRRGARGCRRLRDAVELVRVGSGSAMESETRLLIVRNELPEPVLQHEIRDPGGRFVARVDMAFPEHGVVVEYEGDHHRTDPGQWHRDVARYRTLERLGWRTFRVTRSDVRDHPGRTVHELRILLDFPS